MNKQTRWLLKEIDAWSAEKLISPQQALQLRGRYTVAAGGPPWGLIVFATAGAVVLGLGVILLFAYNWDDIPKFGKLGLIFGAIVATHAAGLNFYRRMDWRRTLGECLCLLGTMFYGAGIWLVAQVYNINEHYPTGFLLWGLGALAFAWVFESTAHGILAAVLFAMWGGADVLDFRDSNLWSLFLVLVGVGPLAWRRKSSLLLCVVLVATQFLLIADSGAHGTGSLTFTTSLAFGALQLAAARLTARYRPDFPGGATVLAFLGFTGFIFCTYLLGFERLCEELLAWRDVSGPHAMEVLAINWGMGALALLAWLWLATEVLAKKSMSLAIEEWLVPIALVYCFGLSHTAGFDLDWYLPVSFNLILLGLASMWMWRGCREGNLAPTVLGSLLLACLVLARYFDLFHSLATRGLTFIVLGGIFLAEALYYRKLRQNEAREGGRQ